jgi:hypothetical protein
LNQMVSRAARWAEEQEQFILNHLQSRALTAEEEEIGRLAGVQRPEAVRILATPEVPFPEELDLRAAAQAIGLTTSAERRGLTLGHGIVVRQDHANDEKLIAHELRHVAQYERCGSISTFLQRYCFELNEFRYPETPMEQDAVVFVETLFPGHEPMTGRDQAVGRQTRDSGSPSI